MKISITSVMSLMVAGLVMLGSAPCFAETAAERYEKIIAEQTGANAEKGKSDTDGNFILVIVSDPRDAALPLPDQENLLRLKASQAMSSYLGSFISGKESAETANAADGKTGERFNSMITSEVRQTLSGIQYLPIKKQGENLYCGAVLAEKQLQVFASLMKVAAPSAGGAAKDALVISMGIATIVNGRIDDAKTQALAQAQKQAIEQVLGVMIASTSQHKTENVQVSATKNGVEETSSRNMSHAVFKVFSNTAGFIEQYTVLSETPQGDSYTMIIRAKVARDKLYNNYQSLLKVMGDPEFYLDAHGDEALQQKFDDFFATLGFRVTTVRERAAYIVDVSAKFTDVTHPVDHTKGTRLSIKALLLDRGTGQVVASVANDPRQAVSFVADTTTQEDVVIRKGFEQLRKPLHEKLNAAIVAMSQNGRVVTLLFTGYSAARAKDAEIAVKVANDIPGVRNVTERLDADTGILELRLSYIGRIDDLKNFLVKGFEVNPMSIGTPTVKRVTDQGEIILQM